MPEPLSDQAFRHQKSSAGFCSITACSKTSTFSDTARFTRISSVSGIPDVHFSGSRPGPDTPGYQFRARAQKRGRRSLRLEHVEIFTSPMNTAFEHKIPIKKHSGDFSLECSVINLMLLLFRALLTRQAQPCINSSSAAFSMNLFTDIFFFFAAAATRL